MSGLWSILLWGLTGAVGLVATLVVLDTLSNFARVAKGVKRRRYPPLTGTLFAMYALLLAPLKPPAAISLGLLGVVCLAEVAEQLILWRPAARPAISKEDQADAGT